MLGPIFHRGSESKASTFNAGDWGSILGSRRSLEKEMATHLVFLPGKPYGQKSLVGYCPWVCKGSDTIERLTYTHTHTLQGILTNNAL